LCARVGEDFSPFSCVEKFTSETRSKILQKKFGNVVKVGTNCRDDSLVGIILGRQHVWSDLGYIETQISGKRSSYPFKTPNKLSSLPN
jgi:hypothetical protein